MILCPHVITYILSSSVCLKGVPLITGSSWKPIGKRGKDTKKRTSWFTDIPYLRNPFLSYPRLKSGAGKFRTHLHMIRLINFQKLSGCKLEICKCVANGRNAISLQAAALRTSTAARRHRTDSATTIWWRYNTSCVPFLWSRVGKTTNWLICLIEMQLKFLLYKLSSVYL